MDAVAEAVRGDHRREARAQPLAAGDGAHELAHQQRPVGRRETQCRAAVHLVLAGAALGLEGLGLKPRRAQRRHQRSAERQGPAHGR